MPICHGVDKQVWMFKNVNLTLRQVLFNYKVKSGLQVSHRIDMLLSSLVKKASRQTPAGNEHGGGTRHGHFIK